MEQRHIFRKTFPGLKVLHVFPYFQSLGGVEAVLRLHYANDPDIGVTSEFYIYSEHSRAPQSRVHFSAFSELESIAQISERMSKVTENLPGRVVIYHMLWGIPIFCSSDGAERRFLVQHGDLPDLGAKLLKVARHLDGIICVNRNLRNRVRSLLPHFDASRIFVVDCPIDPPPPAPPSALKNPVRIGYCGRLLKTPKRVDRIPDFVRSLEDMGVPYQFEVLGDGPERSFLENAVPPGRFRFHGVLTGAAYWAALSAWDFISYFSDSEGTPISLLEAMSQGVMPLYPRLGSGGDDYVTEVSPRLLYSKGNIKEAARSLAWAAGLGDKEIAVLRKRSQRAVLAHQVTEYFPSLYEQIVEVLGRPRISTSRPPWPYRLFRNVSMGTFGKLSGGRKIISFHRPHTKSA